MDCGRVSCVKFKQIDCGHDTKPDERCEYYENNGQDIPEVQKVKTVIEPKKK